MSLPPANRFIRRHSFASLRAFIRETLDLDLIPSDLAIPVQGPVRPTQLVAATRMRRPKAIKARAIVVVAWDRGCMSGELGLGSKSHRDDGDEESDPLVPFSSAL